MAFTIQHIPFAETHQFEKIFNDYISGDARLSKLYEAHFKKISIENYLKTHSFTYVNRNALVTDIKKQNSHLNLSEQTQKNIGLLTDSNTYTITTGHQLCLFTGPMYFIYKIITAINCCEYLQTQFPDKHFVPVYWMASEDHDYEEISSTTVFGKKIKWQTQQTGKVGSFSTEGIAEAITELEQILGAGEQSKKIIDLLRTCYSENTLADATRMLVNELFGKYGLVIIDGDSASLKKLFTEELKKELTSEFSYKAVNETNAYLKENGYSLRVNPREVNLFYAKNNIRERIEKQDGKFHIVNTDIVFSEEELYALLDRNPEAFSPNVITRPLYQQKILPNIAYVGGPGEIAYWLQLKKEFEASAINFPVLVPRRFALIVDVPTQNKLHKAGLNETHVFNDTEQLIKEFISADNDQIDLSNEKNKLSAIFSALKQKAEHIDKSLGGSVDGELQKTIKGLEHIEQKIIRSLKTKNETSINQIRTIKQKLFPESSIQERHDNFISFWLKNECFIDDIKDAFRTNMDDLSSYLLLKEN